jgi:hypothetical protein
MSESKPLKRSKPYITGDDRIQMKVRNPANGKFISRSFKYSDYNGKEGAVEASKKWAEEVQNLIDEKNALDGIPTKPRKQREPEKKLIQEIEQRTKFLRSTSEPESGAQRSLPVAPQIQATTVAPEPIIQQITQTPVAHQEPRLEKKPFPYKSWIPEKTGSSLVLMAKSKAGKTSLLHQIVKELPKDMIKVVISPNIHTSIYDSMRNKCVFSPVFDSRIPKLCHKINQKTKNHYRFCIILDDVVDQKQNSQLLKSFLIYRNAQISCIFSVQSVFLINKMIRGNANYVLLGRLSGEEAIVDTYRKFLINYKEEIGVKSESQVVPVYDELTKDYNFIFMNNLKEKIFLTNKDL